MFTLPVTTVEDVLAETVPCATAVVPETGVPAGATVSWAAEVEFGGTAVAAGLVFCAPPVGAGVIFWATATVGAVVTILAELAAPAGFPEVILPPFPAKDSERM